MSLDGCRRDEASELRASLLSSTQVEGYSSEPRRLRSDSSKASSTEAAGEDGADLALGAGQATEYSVLAGTPVSNHAPLSSTLQDHDLSDEHRRAGPSRIAFSRDPEEHGQQLPLYRRLLHPCFVGGSHFILMDLTYAYVWSRPLFFLCLLTATAIMGEENLYSNSYLQLWFPSSTSCSHAHQVDVCDEKGLAMNITHTVHIPVNIFEDTWFTVDALGFRSLVLVVLVSFANSRYLESLWQPLSLCFGCLIFGMCLFHTRITIWDVTQCGGQAVPIDWQAFKETWIAVPSQMSWFVPEASRLVEEYCDNNSTHTVHMLSHRPKVLRGPQEDVTPELMRQYQQTGAAIQDMWVAWMDSTTFVVPFEDLDYVQHYCSRLHFPDWHQCITWLNGTLLPSTGNHIECSRWGALEKHGWDDATALVAEMQDLQNLQAGRLDPAATGFRDAFALKEMVERAELEELRGMGCEAHVSGKNFGLGSVLMDFQGLHIEAVADHLLSLATRGYQCPDAAVTWPLGPQQLDGSRETCKVNPAFLSQTNLQNITTLYVHEAAVQYLSSPDYMRCTARVVSKCAGRARARYLTSFRSATEAICSSLIFTCFGWMLLIRMCQNHSQEIAVRIIAVRRRFGAMARVLRAGLTSRVIIGLLVAFLLQLGFTIVVHGSISEWISDGRGRDLADQLLIRPAGLVDYLVMSALWLQFLLMTVAIACNIFLHFRLRQQLMNLPLEVFLSDLPLPAEYKYTGPDIQDLRKMGSTSIVYAMYFPGMVFWHLFYSSWMLVLLFSFLTACVVLVLQQSNDRSPYANQIWLVLTKFVFFMSILTSHFLTRLYTQRCLFRRSSDRMEIRCLCLFSWYEVFFYLISFALGPTAALYDFMKGFLCTMLASLIVQKPNFTQFGELADYIYCTYCAALYLERIGQHKYDQDVTSAEEGSLWSDSKPMLMDESFTSKRFCFTSTIVFWCLFLGIPTIVAYFLLTLGTQLGYTNPELSPIYR